MKIMKKVLKEKNKKKLLSIPIILAGGLGTRIKHITKNFPKPMYPIKKKPFLWWIIKYMYKNGIDHPFYITTGHLGNKIKEYFNEQNLDKNFVQCIQEKILLGTGGSIKNVFNSKILKKDKRKKKSFIVTNGDSLSSLPIKKMEEMFFKKKVDILLSAIKIKNSKENILRYGQILFNKKNNNLIGFKEISNKKNLNKMFNKNKEIKHSYYINSGTYIFSNHAMNFMKKFNSSFSLEKSYFSEITNNKNKKKYKVKVYCCNFSPSFIDIGTPSSIKYLDIFVKKNYEEFFQKTI
jgi:D-glycero-alpha-D-manno-heptose 1-phosphate guanylyltransferase